MALHAVPDGGEVVAALDLVVEVGRRDRLFGARENLARYLHFVIGVGHLVGDRLEALQIDRDGIEVTRQQDTVEAGRHDGRERYAVRPHAGQQHLLDFVRAVLADAGLLIGRDIGSGDIERRFSLKRSPPEKYLPANRFGGPFGEWQFAQVMMVLTR